MRENSVTLYVMTQKGYKVLESIYQSFPDIIGSVVSSKDENIKNDYYDYIRAFCLKNKIPFYKRTSAIPIISNYGIAISWRWLIKPSPPSLIIFHDSLLPKYRGFNPLVSALINGESEIGVTAIFASEEYDRGAIIANSSISINYPIKIKDAISLIIENYKELAVYVIKKISKNESIKSKIQNEAEATYSLWRDDDDYKIDWRRSSLYIKRFIDAVGDPYLGAKTFVDGKKARIHEVDVEDDVYIENRTPGKVIFMKEGCPVVVCGRGLLIVQKMIDADTGSSLIPLSKFRTRFK